MPEPAATALQIFLLLVLVVVGPPIDLLATRGLKRQPDTKKKLRYYRMGVAFQWICAALACVSLGLRACFFLRADVPLLSHTAVRIGLFLLLVLILLGNFRPALNALKRGSISPKFASYLRRL